MTKRNAMTINKANIETNLDILRDLINKSNDAIFVVDPTAGLFIFVNDKACTSLGYDRQELLKMGVMDTETLIRPPRVKGKKTLFEKSNK